MFEKTQKPIDFPGSAWCPGGRTSAYALSTVPSSTASAATIVPPAASTAISSPNLPIAVPSPASPPVAPTARTCASNSGVCTRRISSSVAGRARNCTS